MWKACSSEVWFSMVQSSTAPTLVVMAGGSSLVKRWGTCPSTVMKKLTGGLLPMAASEKYSFLCVVAVIAARPENRCVTGGAGAAGTTADGCCTAVVVGTMLASTCATLELPTGPV